MDHGNRRAPVALARDAPVLDTKSDCGFAEAFRLRFGVHVPAGFGAGQAGPLAGVLHHAIVSEGGLHVREPQAREFAIHRADHGTNGDSILGAEFEIALVVRGHGHDGAGAIGHQDEVADPNRRLFAAVRIDGVVSGEEAFLEDVAGTGVGARIDHGLGARLSFAIEQLRGERMLGRQDHASGAEDGVHARGEDPYECAGPEPASPNSARRRLTSWPRRSISSAAPFSARPMKPTARAKLATSLIFTGTALHSPRRWSLAKPHCSSRAPKNSGSTVPLAPTASSASS